MWVKAADKGMTAAFGTISNPTTKDIRMIGVRSNLFTPIAQFHEMAKDAGGQMIMTEKEKGPCDSGRWECRAQTWGQPHHVYEPQEARDGRHAGPYRVDWFQTVNS